MKIIAPPDSSILGGARPFLGAVHIGNEWHQALGAEYTPPAEHHIKYPF
jgi:hypothetical protein